MAREGLFRNQVLNLLSMPSNICAYTYPGKVGLGLRHQPTPRSQILIQFLPHDTPIMEVILPTTHTNTVCSSGNWRIIHLCRSVTGNLQREQGQPNLFRPGCEGVLGGEFRYHDVIECVVAMDTGCGAGVDSREGVLALFFGWSTVHF